MPPPIPQAPAPDRRPPSLDASERPRKNTLETFNDELAVLEVPLENDVEYYDEPRPPSRGRRMATIAAAVGVLGAGALLFSRHFPPAAAVAGPAPIVAQPSPVSAPPPVVPSVVPIERTALAEAEPAPAADGTVAPDEAATSPTEDVPAPARSGTRAGQAKAWAKISHAGHARHGASRKPSARHHARHR